jgi:exosome complex component RRP43
VALTLKPKLGRAVDALSPFFLSIFSAAVIHDYQTQWHKHSLSTMTHLSPSAMPLISPPALLRAYLNQNPPTRPSNRAPFQPRPIELNTSSLTHTNGSSLVRIGATTIVCGVRAEILLVSEIPSYRVRKTTAPTPTPTSNAADIDGDEAEVEEDEAELALYNLLIPNLSLSTGCSPSHPANAAPSIEAQSLSQRLLSLLLSSRLIRLKDLEIRHTEEATETDSPPPPELKAYWVLYIDMICISYGGSGSVFDAAWSALYAALRDTLLPRAYWDVDESTIYCSPEIEQATHLVLRGCPAPIGFGVFEMNEGAATQSQVQLLIDLDTMEEECMSEKGCVVVDLTDASSEPTILRLEKWGGGNLSIERLTDLLGIATERWREWQLVLGKSIENGKA